MQKYRLNRTELGSERRNQLIHFYEQLAEIQNNMIAESRRTMSDDEREVLESFTQPDHCFSLMFRVLLENKESKP